MRLVLLPSPFLPPSLPSEKGGFVNVFWIVFYFVVVMLCEERVLMRVGGREGWREGQAAEPHTSTCHCQADR
jgi:hypothetical protein